MPHTQLTADQMRQILDGADDQLAGSELRDSERSKLCAGVLIAAIKSNSHGEPFVVILQDLSATGLGFVHLEKMNRGDLFVIPPSPRAQLPIAVTFEVVYCAPAIDGRYRIGGRFINVAPGRKGLSKDLTADPLVRAILS